MKQKPTIGIILLCIVFFSFQLNAQERTIHGIVTTFDSILIFGATIKVQSTVLTDSVVNYIVSCQTKDKLKVSANGFFSSNAKIEGVTKTGRDK